MKILVRILGFFCPWGKESKKTMELEGILLTGRRIL